MSVLVEDDRGAPVPGVEVRLYDESGSTHRGTTDARGEVTFEGIPAPGDGAVFVGPHPAVMSLGWAERVSRKYADEGLRRFTTAIVVVREVPVRLRPLDARTGLAIGACAWRLDPPREPKVGPPRRPEEPRGRLVQSSSQSRGRQEGSRTGSSEIALSVCPGTLQGAVSAEGYETASYEIVVPRQESAIDLPVAMTPRPSRDASGPTP